MDIYYLLLLQIVGGAPLPKPMHLLYAAPCPWCSKTILSTRFIWLIFWIHDGWESEWEKWLQRSLSFRCILRYCESVLGYYSSVPFFILFQWIVWCLNRQFLFEVLLRSTYCWFLDTAQQHLFTEVNSTRPAGSFQGTVVLCWTFTCASDAPQRTDKSACSKSKARTGTHVAL